MKHRLFLDSDVILDLLLKREPFFKNSQKIFDLAEKKKINIYTSALAFSNIYYILSRIGSREKAFNSILKLRALINLLDLTESVIDNAIALNFKDFEDAIQYHIACLKKLDYFVTRNIKDYPSGNITVITPVEYAALL
ncbi:MAG: PIN domain-containing protein [Spirochaetia bacterium]|nr:PIN domain-containing protein [Spirochaetia bacterium]